MNYQNLLNTQLYQSMFVYHMYFYCLYFWTFNITNLQYNRQIWPVPSGPLYRDSTVPSLRRSEKNWSVTTNLLYTLYTLYTFRMIYVVFLIYVHTQSRKIDNGYDRVTSTRHTVPCTSSCILKAAQNIRQRARQEFIWAATSFWTLDFIIHCFKFSRLIGSGA